MNPTIKHGYDDEAAERNKEKIKEAALIQEDYELSIAIARDVLGWTIQDRERTTECKQQFTEWIKQKVMDAM